MSRLENVHVATLGERDGQVTFLHKIEPGPADKSLWDSHVAVAGLPRRIETGGYDFEPSSEGQTQQVPLADAALKRKGLRRLLNKCPSLRE